MAWGNQDPAVCGVGRITEQYGYDVNGRQIAKALRLKRQNSIYGSLGEVVVNGNWTWSRGQIATLNFPSQSVLDHNGYGLQSLADGVNLSFTRSYDTMGRLNGMTTTRIVNENWQTDTIVDNVTYGPANELTQIRVNGVNETRAYNTLGQLTGISYGGTLRHEYRYSASANDGRAVSYKNWQSGEDVQYTYDSLARLTKAETVGPDWGQSFGYDGWGNLLSKSVTKGSAPVMSVTADPATNRLVVSGMTYDANGNVTNMPGVGTLAYDARNRITGAGGVPTRGYDPGNRKIWWKDSTGNTFVDYWLPNGEKLVTYKIDESPYSGAATYTGPVQFLTVTRTLYFAGRQVKVEGRYGVGGYVEWPQPDRLSSNARHHPYGEERGTNSTEYKFATYQRESSGLDYALNRYYSSVYGRFLSSDPAMPGVSEDPGSWNLYAYVQGDPINYSDPEGLTKCGDLAIHGGPFDGRTLSSVMKGSSGNDLLAQLIYHEAGAISNADLNNFGAYAQDLQGIGTAALNQWDVDNGRLKVYQNGQAVCPLGQCLSRSLKDVIIAIAKDGNSPLFDSNGNMRQSGRNRVDAVLNGDVLSGVPLIDNGSLIGSNCEGLVSSLVTASHLLDGSMARYRPSGLTLLFWNRASESSTTTFPGNVGYTGVKGARAGGHTFWGLTSVPPRLVRPPKPVGPPRDDQ